MHHGDLELDPARRRLTRDGQELELARKEFAVLEALMAAEGATVSAEQLLERVWDEHTDPFTNVVRMTIMTLRRKLGEPAGGADGDRGRLPDGLTTLGGVSSQGMAQTQSPGTRRSVRAGCRSRAAGGRWARPRGRSACG